MAGGRGERSSFATTPTGEQAGHEYERRPIVGCGLSDMAGRVSPTTQSMSDVESVGTAFAQLRTPASSHQDYRYWKRSCTDSLISLSASGYFAKSQF